MIGFSGAVGPGPLELVVDEDGSSVANFTTSGGAWSTNGTEIEWEAAGGVPGVSGTAVLSGFPLSPIAVIEVDLRLGNSSGFIGVSSIGPDGAGIGTCGAYISASAYFGGGRNSGLSLSSATWYTARIEKVGDACRFLLDGSFAFRLSVAGSVGLSLFGIMPSLATNVGNPHKFRNLKAWAAPVAR